jgi:Zn-dependent protease with chaperone function
LSITPLGWDLYKKSWKWGVQYRFDRYICGLQLAGKKLSTRFKGIVGALFKRLKISGTVYNAKDYIDPDETNPAKRDPNLYYGTSDGSYAYIDEETMTKHNLSDAEIEATILHELAHVVMEYSLTAFALQKLIENNQKNEKIKTHGPRVLKKLRHLHEKIADIFAGLAGGISVAQALISEYSRGSSGENETHPASAARVAYMRALCCEMQADPYYNTGNGYGKALKERLPYC